jgi:hypothetical protein
LLNGKPSPPRLIKTISLTMDRAISSGNFAPKFKPAGALILAKLSSLKPSFAKRPSTNSARLRLDTNAM